VDHRNIDAALKPILPNVDKDGNIAVTIPQAMAIRKVFEPGMSLILKYLLPVKRSGKSFKLYERPIMLIMKRIKNATGPRV